MTLYIDEDFEGTGTPTGWTLTRPADIDFDGTTAPAPLEGSESLVLSPSSSSQQTKAASPSFTALGTAYAAGLINIELPGSSSSDTDIIILEQADGTNQCQIRLSGGSNNRFRCRHGSAQVNGPSNLGDGTTYYWWLDYVAGTGSDGELTFTYGTVDDKDDVGNTTISITNGTSTDDVEVISLEGRNRGYGDTIFDRVQVADDPADLGAPSSGATVEIPLATLTFTELAPTVSTPVTVEVPTGLLTFTEIAPTIQTPVTVDVGVGNLSFTEFDPAVLTPLTIEIPTGAANITGLVPVVTAGDATTIEVPLGALAYTTFAPTVNVPLTIPIPLGSAVYTGFAPTALTSVAINVPAASLAYNAFAPTIIAPITIEIPTAVVALTGYAPTVTTTVAGQTVTCTLVTNAGIPIPSLSLLSWAWFDEPDPAQLNAPSDQGDMELTDGSGILTLDLNNTSLTSGEVGTLVLRSDDGTIYRSYNLPLS